MYPDLIRRKGGEIMVSSAISGMSVGRVNAAGAATGAAAGIQKSRDTFDTDFSKAMSATLQNAGSGKTGTFEVSGKTEVKASSVKQNNGNTAKNISASDNKKTSVDKNSYNKDAAQAASDIKDKIKETMDVSDEDIEKAMEQTGIGIADLLNPQAVTDLVVALSGNGDSLEFLTDSSAASALDSILDAVAVITNELTESYDISENIDMVSDEAASAEHTVDKNTEYSQEDKLDEEATAQESIADVVAEKTEVKSESHFTDEKKNDSGTHLQGDDGIEKITSDITHSIQQAFSEIVDEASGINETDIVRQVVEQIKVTATQKLSSIEVLLNPENLGKVHVAVTAKQGIVTAQLTAQNEQVRTALENQVTALKEQFNNQGIKVDAVEITVQSHGFEAGQNLEGNDSNQDQAQQENKSHRRLDLSSLEGLDESDMTSEEIRARDAIVNGNSSVEYMA